MVIMNSLKAYFQFNCWMKFGRQLINESNIMSFFLTLKDQHTL